MPRPTGPMPESGLYRAMTVTAPDCENPNQPIICARAMINEDFRELPAAGNAEESRYRFLYCAKQGLLRHAVPASQGGRGDSFSDLAGAHEALGKSTLDCGLLLSINAHLWGALFPLLEYGAQSQKQDWLENLLSGRLIGGHAITEPQAGSDLNALEAQAEAVEDGFVLNGRKRYITNAPIADLLVVYAKLENRLTGFIVQCGDSGANFTDAPAVVGCRSATMGDVELDHCRVPRSRLLGKPGGGQMMIQHALELERAFVFAGFAGVMEGQLEAVLKHSRERRVNGAHLGRHQAISHKIAEMKLRLDTVRLWVNECARLKDAGRRISLAGAQTKLFAAEAFLQSSLDAVQILGSGGLTGNSPMAGLVEDALASRLFSGSSEIQKNIIAALLGTGEGFKG